MSSETGKPEENQMAAYVEPTTSLGGGTATLTRTVVDSVRTAWLQSETLVLDRFDSAFLGWYEDRLLPVIHDRLRDLIADEWASRGRHVEWVDSVDGMAMEEGLTEDDVWAVWDAAALNLPAFTELVKAAGLTDEYAAWH